jgi:ABC-type transport system substrate-binding protein
LVFLTSCTSQNRQAGYIYYRLSTNPTTLDPALIVDVTGGSIAAKLFNGLVKIGDHLEVIPDIAEHWTISDDGLLYTFRLRKGVRFSNNREVKAYDVKYSFQRVLEPRGKSPNTWVFEKITGAEEFLKGQADDIAGIRIINDYTLAIHLRKPFSPFLNLLAMTAAYVVPREEAEKWGLDFSGHPVGTGPFILESWLPNREIRLIRRTDYFDQPAKVEGIIYRIIPEDLTAVTEFELGNIDVLTIPASEFSRYRKDQAKSTYISSIQGLNTYYVGLNCARPPFDNPVLRRAMNYAIDRRKILDTIYEKRGRIANGPLPEVLRQWDIPARYTYNPQKAREMIRKQGLKGITVHLYITAEQEIIDIAEVLQSYMESAGIHVKIKQLEWSAYKEAINNGEPDMFYISWWADYPDPENFLFPLFHSSNHGAAGNRTRFTDHAVDTLIEKGQSAISMKQRNIYYQKAEERIVDEAPWVFLWHRTDFTIRQPWVKNYTIYPIYSMDKGTEISF